MNICLNRMDGFGIFSSTNDTAVIQVKYRSNPNEKPFTKNVFASLFTEAIIKEKVLLSWNAFICQYADCIWGGIIYPSGSFFNHVVVNVCLFIIRFVKT